MTGNPMRAGGVPLTRAVLFGLLVLALVMPAAAYSGKSAGKRAGTELRSSRGGRAAARPPA